MSRDRIPRLSRTARPTERLPRDEGEAPAEGETPEAVEPRPNITPAQIEQRRQARTTHGARSEAQIAPRARNAKRRLLRQIGMRAADLDPIALGLLDAWSSCASKRRALDAYMEERGLLKNPETGEQWPFLAFYVSLVNSERLTLGKLAGYLEDRGDREASRVIELVEKGRAIREARALPPGDAA